MSQGTSPALRTIIPLACGSWRWINCSNSGHLPPPDVIKCDVEGGEYDALAGAVKILTMHRPTIVLATHGPEVHEQCCDLLTTHRYRMTQLEYYGADRQLLATPT